MSEYDARNDKSGKPIYQGGVSCIVAPCHYLKRLHYEITTTHVEKVEGICCQRHDHLQLVRVKDIQHKDDPLFCCCGCGSINIISADEALPVLNLVALPDSKNIYRKLRDALDEVVADAKIEIAM